MLLGKFVDCNADGDVYDRCDCEGDGFEEFTELFDNVTEYTPMLRTAQFMLFFSERVQLSPTVKATLQAHDAEEASHVDGSVGVGREDCVVTFRPVLLGGKLYTFRIPSGTVTDLAIPPVSEVVTFGVPIESRTYPNIYGGELVFKFYTPMTPPTVTVASTSSSEVAKTTLFRLDFELLPRLNASRDDDELAMTLESSDGLDGPEVIRFRDKEKVFFLGTRAVILPEMQMRQAMTYFLTWPNFTFEYQTEDFNYTFTTRVDDTVPPSVVLAQPRGEWSKLELDQVAPVVLFSESVVPIPGKRILIREGQRIQYAIFADDRTCGIGGSEADGCAVLDGPAKRLTIYPAGRLPDGRVAPWTAPGGNYTVELERGSFTDAPSAGEVLQNDLETTTFSFEVMADVFGPALVSSEPASHALDVRPVFHSVTLSFDEALQVAAEAVAVEAWREGPEAEPGAPQLAVGPGGHASVEPLSAESGSAVVVLHFDRAVQAGEGEDDVFEVYGGTAEVVTIAASNATFLGHRVLLSVESLMPPVPPDMPEAHRRRQAYHLRTRSREAVRSAATGAPMEDPVDTGMNPFMISFVPETTEMRLVHTSLDEYACLPGRMPDIDLYFNKEIVALNASGSVSLSACGRHGCGGTSSDTGFARWSLGPDDIISVDPDRPYRATMRGSSLPPIELGPYETFDQLHELVLEKGLFEDHPVLVRHAYTTTVTTTTTSATTTATTTSTSPHPCSRNGTEFDPNTSDCNVTEALEAQGTRRLIDTPDLVPTRGQDYEADWLYRYEHEVLRSPEIRLRFRICEVRVPPARPSTMVIYSEFSALEGARRFKVSIPAQALKDSHGNARLENFTASFAQDASGPEIVHKASIPPMGGEVAPEANIVLSFNEVVQAGRGHFYISEYNKTNAMGEPEELKLRFAVDVARVAKGAAAGAMPLISGHQVVITPRSLCSAAYCGDLVEGTQYVVTTSGPGVLLDAYGNRLPVMDGKMITTTTTTTVMVFQNDSASSENVSANVSSYTKLWSPRLNGLTFAVTADPQRPPRVAYAAGEHFEMATDSDGVHAKGYIMIDEQVHSRVDSPVIVELCDVPQPGISCPLADADGPVFAISPSVTLGGGAEDNRTDDIGEYGLLQWQAFLPNRSRRYKVTLRANSLWDAGHNDTGPAIDFVYHIDVGPCPVLPALAKAPTLMASASTPAGERPGLPPLAAVPRDSLKEIVLAFSEVVQAGGSCQGISDASSVAAAAQLCLDQDEGCANPALFVDGTHARIPLSHAHFAQQRVTLPLPQALRERQRLRVVLPSGFVTNLAHVPLEAVVSQYNFFVAEQDTVAPVVHYFNGTTKPTSSVMLLFNEAVQFAEGSHADGAVTVVDISDQGDMKRRVEAQIDGNEVTIFGGWKAGSTYSLGLALAEVADLAGNVGKAMSREHLRFTINGDVTPPTLEIRPTSGTQEGVDPFSAIMLEFNEVMQAGTGVLSLYMKNGEGCDAQCSGGRSLIEQDVQSLRVVNFARDFFGLSMLHSAVILYREDGPLVPDASMALRIPATAFADAAGNPFTGLVDFSGYQVTGAIEKDMTPPEVAFVDAGGESPNKEFAASSELVVYFTEAVQVSGSGGPTIKLVPSNGGFNCDLNQNGRCGAGEICTYACGYTPASAEIVVPLGDITIRGVSAKVTLPASGLPGSLEQDKGYKLVVVAGSLKDTVGHEVLAYDGESDSASGVLRAAIVRHKSQEAPGPRYTATSPPHNGVMVPLSATIQITFDEVAQAGSGSLTVSPQPDGEPLEVPIHSCIFVERVMTCKLPETLKQNTKYAVRYDASAVLDFLGNEASNPLGSQTNFLHFHTIDVDYQAPTLAGVQGMSFAERRRLLAMPSDPRTGAVDVAKGTLVALTFSETVQAGSGGVAIMDCSAGDPLRCFDGGFSESHRDVQVAMLNVREAQDRIVFDDRTVYMEFDDLLQGRLLSLQIHTAGVFLDLNRQPLAKLDSGLEFQVAFDDTLPPEVYYVLPLNDTTEADDSVTRDIILWFSEAVQSTNMEINVSDGNVTRIIPANNSDPMQGTVTIDGVMVVIDPYDEFGYNKNVTVTIPRGTFLDLYGQPFEGFKGTDYQYRTTTPEFVAAKGNTWKYFPPREGAVVHYFNNSLFLFGGKMGNHCMPDAWISPNGTHWTEVKGIESKDSRRYVPQVAYGPSAVDKYDCLWILGGECNMEPWQMWKSCDRSITWKMVPEPTVVPFQRLAPPPYPKNWHDHAMIMVGGWQLLIVDAANATSGGVWRFTDYDMKNVQRLSTKLPFPARKRPQLVVTTENIVYMVGGFLCDDSGGFDSDCNEVFNDVWVTKDVGETWACLTASYAPLSWTPHSVGVGRYPSVVATHDDYIFILGGHVPKTENVTGDVYSSYHVYFDNVYAGVGAAGPFAVEIQQTPPRLRYVFREAIRLGNINATMTHLATNKTVQVRCNVSRQLYIVEPIETLVPGGTYTVQLHQGAVLDLRGTPRGVQLPSGNDTVWFHANPDTVAPALRSMYPEDGALDVAPWTTVVLTMNEAVQKGEGELLLVPTVGKNISFHVKDALIVDKQVFFEPSPTLLTAGMTYTVHVPQGFLLDLALNPSNASSPAGSFFALSWAYTEEDYTRFHKWPNEKFEPRLDCPPPEPIDDMKDENASNATEENVSNDSNFSTDMSDPVEEQEPCGPSSWKMPELLRMYPVNGATDVPAKRDIALMFFFSRPVRLNLSKPDQLIWFNTTSLVKQYEGNSYLNMSVPFDVTYVEELPRSGALRIIVPPRNTSRGQNYTMLEKMSTYSVYIPHGLVQDDKGFDVGAFNVTFTTLYDRKDRIGPRVVMTDPPRSTPRVPGCDYEVNFWFSEEIEPGRSGSIRVVPPRPLGFWLTVDPEYDVPISSENITVSGTKLTLSLRQGAWRKGGPTTFFLPKGLVGDKERKTPGQTRGNEGGKNPSFSGSLSFTTVKDDVPPTYVVPDQLPPHEADGPQYRLPETASLLLHFSEIVQAGTGRIRLVPRYTAPEVIMEPREAMYLGKTVAVPFKEDLLPGQVYSVHVDPDAIVDINKNHFDARPILEDFTRGPIPDYKISTGRHMEFRKVATQQWTDEWSMGRFGAGAATDGENTIYFIGGRNSSKNETDLKIKHNSTTYTNDVWRIETMREVNCATAYQEIEGCSSDWCLADEASPSGFSLGSSLHEETILRTPTKRGRQCPGFVPAPGLYSKLGEKVSTKRVVCPCPICVYPPGPPGGPKLPDFMPNETYIDAYRIVTASNETRPLFCNEGRAPTSPFRCAKESRYFGRWREPYPSCENLTCTSPPNGSAVNMFRAFNPPESTRKIHCGYLNDEIFMPHAGVCAIKCAPGWKSQGGFICDQGKFQHPTCAKQRCVHAPAKNGRLICQGGRGPLLNTTCTLLCDAGYRPSVDDVLCMTYSKELEAKPQYYPRLPTCSKSSCGPFTFLNGTKIDYGRGNFLIGDRANATCSEGYVPRFENVTEIVCAPTIDLPGKPNVVWQRNGSRAGPLCVEKGKWIDETVYLEGIMEVRLNIGEQSIEQFACRNESFDVGSSLAIAAGLCAASAAVPISVFSVRVINTTACKQFSERLLSGLNQNEEDWGLSQELYSLAAARRTAVADQTSEDATASSTPMREPEPPKWLGLGFQAYVDTMQQAEIVLKQMGSLTQEKVFIHSFKEGFQESVRVPVSDILVTALAIRSEFTSMMPTTSTTTTTTTTTTKMVRLSGARPPSHLLALLVTPLLLGLRTCLPTWSIA
eukprot:TRINITY_DN6613_c1_g1_i3.p1 TRINITY_DN6613_c1_g1~~TRINITY_DN6613_c1_g1_i3.p1  ORF type:complete len:3740 (+),score=726.59 TRINITY_DN6613_c1_g1_i3:1432-12651(+)